MKLELRRSNSGQSTLSGVLPSTAYPIGKPMMVSDVNAGTGAKTFALANGRCDGFLTRESRVPTDNDAPSSGANGNPRTAEEQLMGFGMETPFTAGREGSIEMAEWVEAEGSDYLVKSGTGTLASATGGEEVSFSNGKFYEAQSGDYVQYRVVKSMTPEEDGDLRLLMQAIPGGGYKKA